MASRIKIFKPHSELNELEDRFKIVAWRNGTQFSIKFAETRDQALEKARRLQKQMKIIKD